MSFDDKKQNITSIKDVKKREYKTPKCSNRHHNYKYNYDDDYGTCDL